MKVVKGPGKAARKEVTGAAESRERSGERRGNGDRNSILGNKKR